MSEPEITTERLEQIVEADVHPTLREWYSDEHRAMARELLRRRQGEPVAWRVTDGVGDTRCLEPRREIAEACLGSLEQEHPTEGPYTLGNLYASPEPPGGEPVRDGGKDSR